METDLVERFRLTDILRVRMKNEEIERDFLWKNPMGRLEILPSPFTVYDFQSLDKNHKIVYQIIREITHISLREYLVFYLCERKELSLFRKYKWRVLNEIPADMVKREVNEVFTNNFYNYGKKEIY